MGRFYCRALIFLSLFSGFFGVIQCYITQILKIYFYYNTFQIYCFCYGLSLLLLLVLFFTERYSKGNIGFAFLGVLTVRMLSSVCFIFPAITSRVWRSEVDILVFIIPYFLFLFIDVVLVRMRLLLD